jgi:hypothetical protein
MNVENGAEAAIFPEKEYISRIFIAVQGKKKCAKYGFLWDSTWHCTL